MSNHYETLGVEETATIAEIKKAYRELSKKYHPDVNSEEEAKYKEISHAYAVLSNEKKRREYDFSFKRGNKSRSSGWGPFRWDSSGPFSQHFNFEVKQVNSSIVIAIPYKLSEFLNEKKTTITFDRKTVCDCKGLKDCSVCNNQGFTIEKNIKKEITIPPGLNVKPFILEKEGNIEFNSLPPGDIYVKPILTKTGDYQIISSDIVFQEEVDPVMMLFGGNVKIKSPLDEEISLYLPSDADPNTIYTIHDKGLPVAMGYNTLRGKLHVKVSPVFKNLDEDKRRILNEYYKKIIQK